MPRAWVYRLTSRIAICSLFMVSICTILSSGKEPSASSRFTKALNDSETLSQNAGVLMRMHFNKFSADPAKSSNHVQYVMGLCASGSEADKARNELWFRSSYSGGMDQSGVFSTQRTGEVYASYGKRIFVGLNGSADGYNIRNEFHVRELTTEIENDDAFKVYSQRTKQELQMEALALPFLSFDALYAQDANFNRSRAALRTKSIVWEKTDDTGVTIVWASADNRGVSKCVLSSKYEYLPSEYCYYLRPAPAKPLVEGDKLGELIYRTTTDWARKERGNTKKRSSRGLTKDIEQAVWLPVRIVLEEAPKSAVHILEIDLQWKLDVAPQLISPEVLLGQVQPNPIAELYEELSTQLEETIQANDRKSRAQ